METIFADLEEAIMQDPQIIAVKVDNQGIFWALVGEIITMDKKNYGYWLLDLSAQQCYPVTMHFSEHMHANLHSGDNHFCMGPTGDAEYAQLIASGKYSAAAAFFIYRISKPQGAGGYRSHYPNYQPSFHNNAVDRLRGDLASFQNRNNIWSKTRSDEELEKLFASLGQTVVTSRRQRAARPNRYGKPYIQELVTLSVEDLRQRVFDWRDEHDEGYEFGDLDARGLITYADVNGLLNDVYRIIENEIPVWQKNRNEYVIPRWRIITNTTSNPVRSAITGQTFVTTTDYYNYNALAADDSIEEI